MVTKKIYINKNIELISLLKSISYSLNWANYNVAEAKVNQLIKILEEKE